MPSEQTFNNFIGKNHRTYKEKFPRNQSAVQVIDHSSEKQYNDGQKRLCCRRKTKIISPNDFMHRQQPLPLIKRIKSYTDADNKQFLENPFHEKHESLENLGISSHAVREDRQSGNLNSSDYIIVFFGM
jgi:DNA-directed RNA polymerase subunit N (RpoN/RPB10)